MTHAILPGISSLPQHNYQVHSGHQGCFQEDLRRTVRRRALLCARFPKTMSGQPLAIPWRQAWHANQGPTSTTRTASVDDTSLQGRRHLSPTQAGHLAPSLRKSYTLQIPCLRGKWTNRHVHRPQFYPDWQAGRPQYMELFKAPARYQATKATSLLRTSGPSFLQGAKGTFKGTKVSLETQRQYLQPQGNSSSQEIILQLSSPALHFS